MPRFAACLAVFAVVLCSARAARAGVKDDSISGTTTVGSGTFVQALEMYRHFMDEGPREPYFAGHHADDEESEDDFRSVLPPEPTHLAWELGYTFDSTVTQSATAGDQDLSDTTHSFLGGLDWEALPVLDMSVETAIDTIPAENYRHGRIALHIEYFFSFYHRPGSKDEDEDAKYQRLQDDMDARKYYKKHRQDAEAADSFTYEGRKHPPKPVRMDLATADEYENDDGGGDDETPADELESRYPNLRVALNLQFDRHLKQPESVTRIPGFKQPAGDIFLNQYGEGLEGMFDLDERWSFRAAAMYFYYDRDVDAFTQFLEGGGGARQRALGLTGVGSLTNQLTSFQNWSFDQQVTRTFNDRFSLDLNLNESIYQVSGVASSITFNPVLNIQVNKLWEVSPGGAVVLQGGDVEALGTLGITYDL